MSKYSETKTAFKDAKLLCEAIAEMEGITMVDIHETAVQLEGYHGDKRKETAEIIVPRHNTGISASNDLGFKRQADGTYAAILSEYDRSMGFNEGWLNRIKAKYTEKAVIAQARRGGLKFTGKKSINKKTGNLDLVFVKA